MKTIKINKDGKTTVEYIKNHYLYLTKFDKDLGFDLMAHDKEKWFDQKVWEVAKGIKTIDTINNYSKHFGIEFVKGE